MKCETKRGLANQPVQKRIILVFKDRLSAQSGLEPPGISRSSIDLVNGEEDFLVGILIGHVTTPEEGSLDSLEREKILSFLARESNFFDEVLVVATEQLVVTEQALVHVRRDSLLDTTRNPSCLSQEGRRGLPDLSARAW